MSIFIAAVAVLTQPRSFCYQAVHKRVLFCDNFFQCLYFNCRRRTRSAASTSLLIEPEPSGREPSVSRSLYDVQEEQEHRIPEANDIQPPEVILPVQILEEVTVDPAKAVEALLRYRISSVIRRTFFLPKQSQRSRSVL